MVTVTGLTAARMLDIENNNIHSGSIDANSHLILTKKNGTTVDAGYVKGDKGDTGNDGATWVPTLSAITGVASITPVASPLSAFFAPAAADNAWLSFTTKASGLVHITIGGMMRPGTAGASNRALIGCQIRTGSTYGGGTEASAPGSRHSFGNANTNLTSGTVSYWYQLTPLTLYHARIMLYQVSANSIFGDLHMQVANF